MQSIQFLGASGIVTGSSYLVTTNDAQKFLIDCGMFQGGDEITRLNTLPLTFRPQDLAAVFLTHAHLDHSGRLPLLTKNGYRGKVYMTEATAKLIEVLLLDSAKIAKEDKYETLLYDEADIALLLEHVEYVTYDTPYRFGSLEAVFHDAGHILGSASIELREKQGQSIIFSGDLGNTPEDMIRPTEYFTDADIVVMESTYGDENHTAEDPSQVLKEEIQAVEADKSVLLIPAFSLERTQELLHRINHLKRQGAIKPTTQVFMDSPMAIRATEIFREFDNLYNQELTEDTKDGDPFSFPGLVVTDSTDKSKAILTAPTPKVIIAGSGMMSGGRILHHLANYIADPTTRILVVGYQSEETLGRAILEGKKAVKIYHEMFQVRAHVRDLKSMSSHADKTKLLAWFAQIKGASELFLTHGDEEKREALKKIIAAAYPDLHVSLPARGQAVSLRTS